MSQRKMNNLLKYLKEENIEVADCGWKKNNKYSITSMLIRRKDIVPTHKKEALLQIANRQGNYVFYKKVHGDNPHCYFFFPKRSVLQLTPLTYDLYLLLRSSYHYLQGSDEDAINAAELLRQGRDYIGDSIHHTYKRANFRQAGSRLRIYMMGLRKKLDIIKTRESSLDSSDRFMSDREFVEFMKSYDEIIAILDTFEYTL